MWVSCCNSCKDDTSDIPETHYQMFLLVLYLSLSIWNNLFPIALLYSFFSKSSIGFTQMSKEVMPTDITSLFRKPHYRYH